MHGRTKNRVVKVLGTALGALLAIAIVTYGLFRLWSVFFWDGPQAVGTHCRMNFYCKSSNCSRLTATAQPASSWEFGGGGRGYCTSGCDDDGDCRREDLRCLPHKGKNRCTRVVPAR